MNQHYVPRVYLKNFAEKRGTEYYVNVYDKTKDTFFKTNIKNICSETNLYTLNETNPVAKHVLAVEKIYSDFIEPLYAKAYNTLTNDNIFYIDNQQRVEILVGIFQLYFRNPIIFRKNVDLHILNVKESYNKALLENQKGLTYLDEDFNFKEWTLEGIQEFIIDKLFTAFKEKHIVATSQLGSFHEFTIIEVEKIIDDSASFLTNDNPLFFKDMLTKTENPFLKGNEFCIPINKKYLVKIYHDNTKRLNFIYRRKTLAGNVNMLNDDIVNKGSRFIIGEVDTFNELNKYKEYFIDTSLNLKIQLIEKILGNEKLTRHSKEGTEILKHYYNKYLINKTLTNKEQHEMMLKIQELNIESKKQKIK